MKEARWQTGIVWLWNTPARQGWACPFPPTDGAHKEVVETFRDRRGEGGRKPQPPNKNGNMKKEETLALQTAPDNDDFPPPRCSSWLMRGEKGGGRGGRTGKNGKERAMITSEIR